MSHDVERFYAAVSVLAGHGHIKQRLIRAYEDNLEAIDEEDLPVIVQQAFADLRNNMHRVMPSNGEGPICASVRKMSVDEASACAISIVSLYHDVCRHGNEAHAALAIDSKDRSGVPPFLVKSS